MLEQLFRGIEDEDEQEVPIPHEVQITRLREAFPRFVQECPFKVGDLVMACSDAPFSSAGSPSFVIAVRKQATHDLDDLRVGSNSSGCLIDMRILNIWQDTLNPVWVESAYFLPYSPPAEQSVEVAREPETASA